jgi:hypothetical protein
MMFVNVDGAKGVSYRILRDYETKMTESLVFVIS